MVIPFKLPTVGPANEKETGDFQDLARIMKDASSSVGWAISIGQALQEGQQFENCLLERVKAKLLAVDSRLCVAYATLLFCVQKVSLLSINISTVQIYSISLLRRLIRRI